MKKRLLITSAALFVILSGVLIYQYKQSNNQFIKPEIIGEGPEGKNKPWDGKYAQSFYEEQERVLESIRLAKAQNRANNGSYANGNLNGFWENKGPFNMPGAFQFCEMDEGTDTIYAVTCGHYGGAQFVWKGTLWGDKWTKITPKHPARYEDVIVIPNGNKRRVILGREEGDLIYSDDAGKTWTKSSGLPAIIHSTIVNRQDNNVIYAVSNARVYKSVDNGTSFTELQNFGGTVSQSRLYSPRWTAQPGSSDVYLARGTMFYKLNNAKTSFVQTATIVSNGKIAMGGDNRRLWIVLNGKNWYSSTNGGTSFTAMPTTGYWYDEVLTGMDAGQFIGINPEDPTIFIGGYSVPLVGKNSGATTIAGMANFWGYYQNAVGNDAKVRNNYHPDFQSNQFFYDKDGKLMTLRSSDGGMFISYNEWKKDSYLSHADMTGVFYNISLYGQPTQETYRGGFIYGFRNIDHLTAGTQDQGWQNTRASSYGSGMLSWDQIQGGDGPSCITGDGKIGWSYNYQGDKEFRRFPLYNQSNQYVGLQGTKTGPVDFTFTGGSYFTPSVGDWDNGDRIWILSRSLRRIVHSNGNITGKEDLFGTGNNFMQGLAQSRQTPSIVYTMRNGIVYKSSNRGDTWTQIANANATGITGLSENRGMAWAIDDNTILFATQSGTSVKSIFSTDGGVTWENVTGSGANLFPAAEVNGMAGSKSGKFIFASTNMGPYVFVVTEKKWYPLATDDDVPLFWGQIVYCVDYGDKEVVHFSTWGQGVWSFTIEENVSQNNVGVQNLVLPTNIACKSMVAPKVTLRNFGSNTLTSVRIRLYVNNVLKETVLHNTNLAKNATEEVTLPSFEANVNATIRVEVSLPNNQADEDPNNDEVSAVITVGDIIPSQNISVVSFSSQETSGEGANNGRALNAIDGDISTFWHSRWSSNPAPMPHELVFNLGDKYNVNSVGWLHRQNNNNGNTKTAEIYLSEDGTNWGTASTLNLDNGTALQKIGLSNPDVAQYVKVVIVNNHPNTNNSSLAEISFYGCEDDGFVTGISKTKNQNTKLYPNPVNDWFKVEGKDLQRVEIYGVNGQLISTYNNVISGNAISCTNLKQGNYIVLVISKNGVSTHKIVKN